MMSSTTASLTDVLSKMQTSLEALQRAFDERLRYDEVREAQVTKLYDELESYKRAEQDERLLDLARGLFLVLDKIDPAHPNGVPIEMVRDELLDCLAAVGIEVITGEPGTLDPRSETVVGLLDDANSPAGESSRVVAAGYRTSDRVVRPRRVMVRRPLVTESVATPVPVAGVASASPAPPAPPVSPTAPSPVVPYDHSVEDVLGWL